MGLGPDIKDVYRDIGSAITIVRREELLSGEFIDHELNAQATKSFIKSFFRNASFPYDTSGEAGDIVTLDVTGEYFIIVHFAGELFENSITEYDAVLYKCNILSGELWRPSGEDVWPDASYHKETEWQLISGELFGLQTEPLFGQDFDSDAELGQIGIERHQLYIPESYNVQLKDRWQSASGEWYQIESIKRRRFPNVVICELGEDTR